MTRPVLIIGPLADAVLEKLVSDYPHKYAKCEPKYANWSHEVSQGRVNLVGTVSLNVFISGS